MEIDQITSAYNIARLLKMTTEDIYRHATPLERIMLKPTRDQVNTVARDFTRMLTTARRKQDAEQAKG